MTQAIPVWVVPANELKRNGGSIEIQGGSAYPVVGLNSDSGGGSFQFESGTDSPPVTAPTDSNLPGQYYNTSTGFYYNWNIGLQAWVAVPKVYLALVSQSGTGAPTATVLENTLGESVSFTRSNVGLYLISGDSGFNIDKTMKQFAAGAASSDQSVTATFTIPSGGPNAGKIEMYIFINNSRSDSALSRSALEILVYP